MKILYGEVNPPLVTYLGDEKTYWVIFKDIAGWGLHGDMDYIRHWVLSLADKPLNEVGWRLHRDNY